MQRLQIIEVAPRGSIARKRSHSSRKVAPRLPATSTHSLASPPTRAPGSAGRFESQSLRLRKTPSNPGRSWKRSAAQTIILLRAGTARALQAAPGRFSLRRHSPGSRSPACAGKAGAVPPGARHADHPRIRAGNGVNPVAFDTSFHFEKDWIPLQSREEEFIISKQVKSLIKSSFHLRSTSAFHLA